MSKKSTGLEALHRTFEENGIPPENMMANDTLIREIKQYYNEVREYYITEDTGWYSEKKGWKGPKIFVMVRKIIKKQDDAQEALSCNICNSVIILR